MTEKKFAIIFDFDNTLVKSNINFPAMKISMARMVREYGIDLGNDEEIPGRYTAGNIIDEVGKYDADNNTNLVLELWKVVENFERSGMEDISVDEEVFLMLKWLYENDFSLSILTNNSRAPTLEVLEKFQLKKFFDLIVAREDISKMKPDKEGLELIIQKLFLNPDNVVFVGDSWVDGKAAKNANIRFILFNKNPLDSNRYNIDIWKHITSMSELIELMKLS
ncbi:MAG: HAD-IA family hydrolase [Candidatus Heimdallarchaeota archaeon]|nr:HAD-IA family hydrolase [Candidatus Heimdallarchaeota archaeon]